MINTEFYLDFIQTHDIPKDSCQFLSRKCLLDDLLKILNNIYDCLLDWLFYKAQTWQYRLLHTQHTQGIVSFDSITSLASSGQQKFYYGP